MELDLHHYFCCNKNKALCGMDISGCSESDEPLEGEKLCVVCEDLSPSTAHCGALFCKIRQAVRRIYAVR